MLGRYQWILHRHSLRAMSTLLWRSKQPIKESGPKWRQRCQPFKLLLVVLWSTWGVNVFGKSIFCLFRTASCLVPQGKTFSRKVHRTAAKELAKGQLRFSQPPGWKFKGASLTGLGFHVYWVWKPVFSGVGLPEMQSHLWQWEPKQRINPTLVIPVLDSVEVGEHLPSSPQGVLQAFLGSPWFLLLPTFLTLPVALGHEKDDTKWFSFPLKLFCHLWKNEVL